MAAPKTFIGGAVLLRINTTGVTYAHPCMINGNRSFNFGSAVSEFVIPDCDDPASVGWVERQMDGLTLSVSGSGYVDSAGIDQYWDWYSSAAVKNVQAAINVSAANGGGHWAFAAYLTEWSVGGERKGLAECDATILSSGVVTWVPAT